MRVLIVEDEMRVRKGIVSKVSRLSDVCEVAGEAKNGEEAFGMLESLKPDIIITDIKMPGMNGLLLIEKAKEQNPLIKFIIISGYDDFEFARRAIRLGVFDYLLKPVVNKELQKALENLCIKIQKEKEEMERIKSFQEQLEKDGIARKNRVMSGYYAQIPPHKGEIIQQICPPGECLERKLFTAVKVIVKNVEQTAFPNGLLQFIMANVLEEVFNVRNFCIAFFRESENGVINGLINHDVDEERIIKTAIDYERELSKILNGKVYIAIGRSYRKFEEYKASHYEAEVISRQILVYGSKCILNWQDYINIKDNDFALSEDERRMIMRYLMFVVNERDSLKKLIASILDRMYEQKISYANFKTVFLDLMITITNEVRNKNNGWLRDIYNIDIENMIPANASVTELKEQCFKMVDGIYNVVKNDEAGGGKKIVSEIERRMHEEYFYDLKLSAFAEEYFINQSYLSTLFLQETGENFSKYLTNIRINKAKELLETTEFSTMRVAEFVGYNDRSYFAGVFQKHVGVSPAEYRKRTVKIHDCR